MKKLLAVLMVVCLVCGCFAGCTLTSSEEPAPEETQQVVATSTPVAPENTPVPIVDIEYDKTKFVLDGAVLKAYIGNEKEVTIPEKIIKIGDNAFKDCETVETIKFADTITSIGDYAFYGCKNLKEIKLPKMVNSVGKYAIAECPALTYAEMPTNALNLSEGIFFNDKALATAKLSNSLVIIPEKLFANCENLTEINALSALTTIGKEAFAGCVKFVKIAANSVTTVGDGAFKNAAAFEDAAFSTSINTIGAEAFEGTKWLINAKAEADQAKVEYESKLSSGTEISAKDKSSYETKSFVIVGNGILLYWSGLLFEGEAENDIKVINKVKAIGTEAYKQFADRITQVTIPNTVNAVAKNAFEGFSNVVSASIGSNIVEIPEGLFKDCVKLADLKMLGRVTSIGASAFENCEALNGIVTKEEKKAKDEDNKATEAPSAEPTAAPEPVVNTLEIPKTVTKIGDRAFYGVKVPGKLVTDNELLTIGNEAFFGCEGLSDVTIGEAVANVGAKAFDKTPWLENATEDVVVGAGVLLKTANDKEFAENVTSASITLSGALSEKQFYNNQKLFTVVIPEGVTEIPDYAFYFAENLVSVELPKSVTKIGKSAFQGCKNLKSINLDGNITEIGDYAFYACTSLTKIELPDSLTKIGKFAFYNALNAAEIIVPANVTEIGEYAFNNTAWFNNSTVKFLVVGKNILIKYYAFEDETVATAADGFSKICGGAFDGTPRLTKITLPANVTEIGAFAFSSASKLKEIAAPGVTKVGNAAFNYCLALEKATFAGGASIAEDAFNGCENYNK